MRIITYPLLFITLAVLVIFSLTNKHMVDMGIWPLEQTIALPAFAWFLGSLAVGVILGVILSSLGRQKQKAKLRILKRQTEQQHKEAEAIKAEAQAMIAEPRQTTIEESQTRALTPS